MDKKREQSMEELRERVVAPGLGGMNVDQLLFADQLRKEIGVSDDMFHSIAFDDPTIEVRCQFFFSKKQSKILQSLGQRLMHCQLDNGKIVEYTECASMGRRDKNPNFPDSECLGEGIIIQR